MQNSKIGRLSRTTSTSLAKVNFSYIQLLCICIHSNKEAQIGMLFVSPWPGNMMSNMLLRNIVYFWFLINWEDPRPTRHWPDHFLLNYHFTRCTCNLKHKASCNVIYRLAILHTNFVYQIVFVGFQWWFAQKGHRSQGMKVSLGVWPKPLYCCILSMLLCTVPLTLLHVSQSLHLYTSTV